MWAAQLMQMSRPHSFISSGGLGVMGYELPAAMGAQVARPNATVWSIAGDGGFQMTPHELATLVNEGLPVKIALINNGSLGMVHQWQDLFYGRRYESSVAPGPDYVKLAQAYGFPAVRVTDKDDVEAALEEALRHRGPFLIDFVVDPAENVYPMVPPGASLGEMVEDPRRHQASMAANGVGPVLSRMVR
jgi:acetolactate synthase-1/2/3 large subunit